MKHLKKGLLMLVSMNLFYRLRPVTQVITGSWHLILWEETWLKILSQVEHKMQAFLKLRF